jgi:hypothetical protein
MKKLSEIALKECIVELRAACRLPIDAAALDTMMSWVRPQFAQILDHPDGVKRWADHGQQMRDNGRHVGAFADFFAKHSDVASVGVAEITRAFEMVKADCTVRSERTALAYVYCPQAPVNSRPAEEFLRTVVPVPVLV